MSHRHQFHVSVDIALVVLVLLGFEPSLNGFPRIGQRFIACAPLRPATPRRWRLCDKTGIFARRDNHFQFHNNLRGSTAVADGNRQ